MPPNALQTMLSASKVPSRMRYRTHSTAMETSTGARYLCHTFLGRHHLLGVDGTSVMLPGSDDPRTRVRSNQGGAEHNEAHPSILYDICRRTFEDMVWQGAREQDEPGAFCELVDRLPPAEGPDGEALVPLVLADRNYRACNGLFHL